MPAAVQTVPAAVVEPVAQAVPAETAVEVKMKICATFRPCRIANPLTTYATTFCAFKERYAYFHIR